MRSVRRFRLLWLSKFVCLFVRALDIASKMDHPIFQGFSLEPKVFGVGNTPSINPWIGGGKGREQTSSDFYFHMLVVKPNTTLDVI